MSNWIYPHENRTEASWIAQCAAARKLSNEELQRHASVSLDNRHRCRDCFTCACAAELAKRNGFQTFLVKVKTARGTADLEVPTTRGAEGAGRRAYWAAANLRWGDLDEIEIVSVTELTRCAWFALCDRWSTGTMAHPVLGDVPICAECRAKVERLES